MRSDGCATLFTRRSVTPVWIWFLLALGVHPASAQDEPSNQTDVSGYAFGEYYWMAANHDPALTGANGFWFRRVYLTLDQGLAPAVDMRFRLEMNSAGDFESSSRVEPFVKDAWIRWVPRATAFRLGIQPTPAFQVIEDVWDHRFLEATPLDLRDWQSSRDFGVAMLRNATSQHRVGYHLMVSNGSGTGGETNEGKKVAAALSYLFPADVVLEGYADWDERAGRTDRYTWQLFTGYRGPKDRIGVQFSQQARRLGPESGTDHLSLLSAFYVRDMSDWVRLVTRVDRQFDPDPLGPGVDYLPFDDSAASTLFLGGVEFIPYDGVHFAPNFEYVRYDAEGDQPMDDFMFRMTFFYAWP